MSIDSETRAALDEFLQEGLIAEVLHPLKSGKEATVFCCRAGPALSRAAPDGGVGSRGRAKPRELVAAKVHRPIRTRLFRRDTAYQEGRAILDDRARRAYAARSELGNQVRAGIWFARECEVIEGLFAAGADVPEPLAASETVLLMEYLGDLGQRARTLKDVDLSPEAARPARDRLLASVETMLALHWVHGDLSPFNILWWRERPYLIDFPQSVDARVNPHALDLLGRDLANLDRYFRPRGAGFDAAAHARDLWTRYRTAELVPPGGIGR